MSWLDGYKPPDPGFDEALCADGQIRPAWQGFVAGMSKLNAPTRSAIASNAAQSLLETGIAFDVYADPEDRAAAWRQDYAPLILDDDEWRQIEAGLIQRANVIDALLHDLYGPQSVMTRGLLPSGLVFGNPSYLHHVRGWPEQPAVRLGIFACDITRTIDGHWQVLSDNTGVPNGHGWVLAARIALADAYGDLFNACGIERLTTYFEGLGQCLHDGQAAKGGQGRAVLLAPGPDSPNYFSHAFLARYLGLPLVQASDLTQRLGEVHLKTLGGLQRVDKVLRKLPAHQLDCLSVPGSTSLGSPGLLHSVAKGKLSLFNAAGSGIADNRMLAFLDPCFWHEITQKAPFFEEAPVKWLGDQASVDQVLSETGWQLSPVNRARNIADQRLHDPLSELPNVDARRDFLRREGFAWVAERAVALPSAPAWRIDGDAPAHQRVVPSHWAIRCFVSLDANGKYQVMPGGLVHQTSEAQSVGMPTAEAIKDLWVKLPSGECTKPSMMAKRWSKTHLRRTGRRLLSRHAESLFWLGRYVERAEAGMRVARAILFRLAEDQGHQMPLEALADIADILCKPCGLKPKADHDNISQLLGKVLFKKGLDYGLQQALDGVHQNAAMARGELSQDGVRVLRWLASDMRWRPSSKTANLQQASAMLSAGIQRLMAFAGSQYDNMTRDYAYLFLMMGRRCERAIQIAGVANSLTVGDEDVDAAYKLAAMLEIADSSMTFRSRYATAPLAAPVVDLLILDETNPRSMAFQLERFERALKDLPKDGPYLNDEHRIVLSLLTEIRLLDADALVQVPQYEPERKTITGVKNKIKQGKSASLPLLPLLGDVSEKLAQAADKITIRHFAKAEVPQTSFTMRRGPG